MKKNIFTILFASIFLFTANAKAAVDAAGAEAFVKKVTQDVITEIINAKISQTE